MRAQYRGLATDVRATLQDVHLQIEVLKKEQGPEWPHMKDRQGRYLASDLLCAKANLMSSLAILMTAKD